jgi:hypothetical protein
MKKAVIFSAMVFTVIVSGKVMADPTFESATVIDVESDNASHLEDIHPSSRLIPGQYSANREAISGLSIKTWANEFLVEGVVKYGAMYLPFSINVKSLAPNSNVFQGSGTIILSNQFNTCRYPMTMSIYSYDEGLYLRSDQPAYLPTSLPASGCFTGGSLVEYTHPDIYRARP